MKSEVDFDAKYYAENSKIQLSLASKLLDDYKFKKKAHVLDIGCGDGRITADISKKTSEGNVIGIDASFNMIEYARAHFPKSKFPNLEFLYDRAENLSFSKQFDLIVSFNCFQWVRCWRETLNLLCSFLNPKGELLFLTYPRENIYYQPFAKASENYPNYVDKAAHKSMFSATELREAILENGLYLKKYESFKSTISYQDANEMKEFVRAWLTSFIPLPSILHEEYLDQLIIESKHYQIQKEDGGIHLPYTALFINACKD